VEPSKGEYARGVRIPGCSLIHFQPFVSVLQEIGRDVTRKLSRSAFTPKSWACVQQACHDTLPWRISFSLGLGRDVL